ncbi:MAG: hypothetical protein ACFB12_09750 [Leptolyngbyaceae cyanobacterium]
MRHHQNSAEVAIGTAQPSLWLRSLWRRLTVSLMLLLGVAVFMTAVGIDSRQQAAAADISSATGPSREFVRTVNSNSVTAAVVSRPSSVAGSYREYDAETANRLRHGALTSASLTASRLTRSHLFTQQR